MKKEMLRDFADELLVKEYINGNNEALGIIYERYVSKIYYKCYSFVKNSDEALDLSHEILLKVFSKMGSFKYESKFSTWIFAITKNYCIENYRKSQQLVFYSIKPNHDIFDDSELVDDYILIDLKDEEVKRCYEMLDSDDKEIIWLKYYLNYSIQDIQTRNGFSSSAVKMRLLRARKKLGKLIESNSSIFIN